MERAPRRGGRPSASGRENRGNPILLRSKPLRNLRRSQKGNSWASRAQRAAAPVFDGRQKYGRPQTARRNQFLSHCIVHLAADLRDHGSHGSSSQYPASFAPGLTQLLEASGAPMWEELAGESCSTEAHGIAGLP
jgi:hypothetical protein